MLDKKKKSDKTKGNRLARKLSALNAGEKLRLKSFGKICKTLTDLRQIAAVCTATDYCGYCE